MRGGRNLIDLTGRRFGRLVVLRQGESRSYGSRDHRVVRARWVCQCDCGAEALVVGFQLRRGGTTSCGCYQRERASAQHTKHGQTRVRRSGSRWFGSPAYEMLRGARQRAKHYNVPCTIALSDIVIPARCPVFDVPLVAAEGGFPQPNSPSLDRIIPALGYVPSNICVISHRANVLKRDATIEDLEKVIDYMRRMQTC